MLTFDDEREYAIWLDAGYTCPGCGCDYRYRFKVGVLGDSEEEATGRARRKVLSKGLRDIPCPECGRVTAPNHRYRNPVIAVAMAAFCVVVAVVALGFWQTHLFKITAGAVSGGIASGFALAFAFWLLASCNAPNKARQRKAQELLQRNRLHAVNPEGGSRPSPSLGRIRAVMPTLSVPILGAAILLTAGIGIPLASKDYNREVTPGFLSPGDEATYQFPDEIRAVKGHWRGEPQFESHSAAEPMKPIRITGTGSNRRWGEEMIVKSHETDVRVHPSIGFRLPVQKALTGQTIEMKVSMEVEYPQSDGFQPGGFQFHDHTEFLETTLQLRIVSTEEMNRLKGAWWVAYSFAVACFTVPPLVVMIRAIQARRTRYVLDLQPGTPPKSAGEW